MLYFNNKRIFSTVAATEVTDAEAVEIVQTPGSSETAVMSQAATTALFENVDSYKRILTGSDDIDNIENGAYKWNASDTPVNAPAGAGVLIQYGAKTGGGTVQLISKAAGNRLFVRYRTLSGWSGMKEVASNSDVQTLISNLNRNIFGIHEIEALTSGEVCKINTSGFEQTKIYAVDESGEIYEKEDYVYTTDFMLCPKYLLIDMEDSTSRLVLYFYDLVDGNYIPRWDLLRIVNSENELNRLSRSKVRNRIIEIPDGVYMKAGLVVDGNTALYGWSGVHVGCEMASTTYTPIANISGGFDDNPMDSKRTGITIPGSARLLWLKDACLISLWGVGYNGEEVKITTEYYQVISLPSGYKYFRADISLDFKSPIDDSGLKDSLTKKTYAINMNNTINCACDYSVVKPYGRALEVINHARDIAEIDWECKADKAINSSAAHVFSAGTKYKGVPYGSQWMKPYYFGWHITKHTFLNAVNDEDSIFYKESARTGRSTGYGTVCSAFATLCQGFPYPVVTRGFLRDPHIIRTITDTPHAGTVMYDGGGHTIIPETNGEGKDFSQYTLYESVSPITLRRSCFDFIDNDQHNTLAWSYINPYIYAIHHDEEVGYPNAYDVKNGTIINGTARPYRGDRGVYSSNDDIKINIKDSSATKCFVQRCSYDANNDTFVETSDSVIAIDFTAGTTQIKIDKSILRDGIYGVYTDTDNTMEYFEYRTAPVATYNMSDDNFVFNVGTGENLLSDVVIEDKTTVGITYDGDGNSCHISGVATSTANNTILSSPNAMPSSFVAGQTYSARLHGAEKVYMRIGFYLSDGSDLTWSVNVRTGGGEFTIPENAVGIAIRLSVLSTDVGKQVDETVTPIITNSPKPWYSVWWQDDVPSGITEIIPNEPSGDYRKYREVYNPNGAEGVMFFKGVLGAYTAPLTFAGYVEGDGNDSGLPESVKNEIVQSVLGSLSTWDGGEY